MILLYFCVILLWPKLVYPLRNVARPRGTRYTAILWPGACLHAGSTRTGLAGIKYTKFWFITLWLLANSLTVVFAKPDQYNYVSTVVKSYRRTYRSGLDKRCNDEH